MRKQKWAEIHAIKLAKYEKNYFIFQKAQNSCPSYSPLGDFTTFFEIHLPKSSMIAKLEKQNLRK